MLYMLTGQINIETRTLRKLAYAIYGDYFGCKNENFHWKHFDIVAQNIVCPVFTKSAGLSVKTSKIKFYMTKYFILSDK